MMKTVLGEQFYGDGVRNSKIPKGEERVFC